MIRFERQGAVEVVSVIGRLDVEHVGEIAAAVDDRLLAGVRLVLDLARVSVVDGAGLEWLLDLLETVTDRAGEVKLAAAPPLIETVLDITGVGEHFDRHGAVLAAVGGFSG